MIQHLPKILRQIIKSKDLMHEDFKIAGEGDSMSNLNFHNVRGSVRLIDKKVLTPQDIAAMLSKVMAIKLPQ